MLWSGLTKQEKKKKGSIKEKTYCCKINKMEIRF